jgi:amino acid transporter
LCSISQEIRSKTLSSPSNLTPNSVGLSSLLMQSIAQIAPALGILSTLGFNTKLAGAAAPSTYLLAFGVALIVAVTLGQLGKHLPSAGGFYTYVSTTVGPRSGFFVGWIYSWFVAAVPGAVAAFVAATVSELIQSHFAVRIPWQALAAFITLLAALVAYRGIRISGAALMLLSLIEMGIVLALAVCGLIFPGPGGFSFTGLYPAATTSTSGFYLAVVFSIFAFTGWEGAAAIAEETREPKRQIPRAIVGSVIILGAFYVFCAWGLQVGWGTAGLSSLADSNEIPAFAVAERLWGSGWILLLLALVNSGVAVCIACTVDSSRNWYAMARAGALPKNLTLIHAKHHTPSVGVIVQTTVASLVGLGLGSLIGPDQIFFVFGLVGTLVYAIVYCLGNLGVIRYFLTVRREEFRPILHLVFPLLSTFVLWWVAFESLYPLPSAPVSYAPAIVACLSAAGSLVLVNLSFSGRQDWKSLSQRIYEG